MGFGATEIIIFLIIVMLLFGRRIPETMFSLGKGLTEFKKGMKDDNDTRPTDGSSNKVENS
ncbi:Sec-independent protein translocase family protein [Lacunimicrobium album]|jgi:sec-independent protein translocase protein TatA